MAYVYYTDTKNHGGWNATAQARLQHTATTTDTAVTLTIEGAVQYSSANATGYGIHLDVGYNYNTWVSAEGVLNYADWVCATSGTWTFQRGHDAYDVTVFVNAWGNYVSGWGPAPENPHGGYAVTIPAKASYNVTYNANGGSGAPSAQTKWLGETLVLSDTVPTRANYNFKGWATSSSATTATYQPGGTYTANSALTLYAVWELAFLPPTATIRAYRVADASATAENPTGGYAYATVAWSVDTSINASNAIASVTATLTENGTAITAPTTDTPSGTSGTSAFRWTAATGNTYVLTVTVTDTNGVSTAKTATVGNIKYPIYVYDQYKVKIQSLTLGTYLPVGSGGTGKKYGYTWQKIKGPTTGSTALSVSISSYSEVMVVAQTSGYLGTSVLPKAIFTATDQELYLGGGLTYGTGGRAFVANVKVSSSTLTVTPLAAIKDGVDVMSSTSWTVYAR